MSANPYSLKKSKKKKATTAADYKKKQLETTLMDMPSGATFELRKPAPDIVRRIVLELANFGSIDDNERLTTMDDLAIEYMPVVVKTPVIGDDGVPPHEVAFNDRIAIMTWLVGGEELPIEAIADANFRKD